MSRTISVYGVTANIDEPYAEGHTINAAEAKALNQTYAEAVGNNTRSQLKKLLPEGEKAMPEAQHAEARKIIEDYNKDYEITLASTTTRTTLDPVEKEAKKIASDLIKGKMKADGIALKDVDKDKLNEKIATVMQNEKVIAAAKKAVAARSKVSDDLAEISLG